MGSIGKDYLPYIIITIPCIYLIRVSVCRSVSGDTTSFYSVLFYSMWNKNKQINKQNNNTHSVLFILSTHSTFLLLSIMIHIHILG